MPTISKLITQIGQRLLELERPFKIALAVLFLLLLVLLFYPFEIVIVPAWNPRVVDDLGMPVRGINLTEHWQHYQLENEGHEDFKVSDEFGRVSFPARTIRSGLFARGFARLVKLTSSGVEARTDRYASLVVWGSKEHSVMTTVYSEGESPSETIVVQRLLGN